MRAKVVVVYGWALLSLACSSSSHLGPGQDGAAGHGADAGGASPDAGPPSAHQQALVEARATLAAARPADADAFVAKWPAKALERLPYDPASAAGLDVIAASHLGLSDGERAAVARDGFMVSARQTFPSFFYGYKSLYADHLPLYVSIDSVLNAVHHSYDEALQRLETQSLSPALEQLLSTLQSRLAGGVGADLPAETRADVDLFLTVARRLLGDAAIGVAGASYNDVDAIVTAAMAASGTQEITLFGAPRDVDFSQFKPRGHYTDSAALAQYFRTMMWLGRTDFRLLAYPSPTTPPTFNRRQFLAALLLSELADGAPLPTWKTIDDVLRGFVGESDNMTLPDFSKLASMAGVTALADLAVQPDAALARLLDGGGFGVQRIASQLLLVPPEGAGAPLDRVFLFFGQRFVIDSEVLSNVVFDRVRGDPQRLMASPLDVAFGALGNAAAVPLLGADLRRYPSYAAALSDARTLVDQHGDDFWGESLYGTWLASLRALSAPAGDPTTTAGLPSVMKTAPWARRVLSSQLASWAELRHDTILYAKQAYGAIPTCEFPDAFVDPYPEAWAGLVRLARLGQAVAAAAPTGPSTAGLAAYFSNLEHVAATLEGMARAELTGQPLSADQLAFINQAVSDTVEQSGCTQVHVPQGWYAGLFLNLDDAVKFDPTIADVYTDAAEQRVLHVGTGYARYMVVTVDTCTGARAYAGLVSSYYEATTENFERLDDESWQARFSGSTSAPDDVPWIASSLAR